MTLKIKLLSIMVALFLHTHAQKTDSDSLINKIKSEITIFFIQKGLLNEKEVRNNLNYIFAIELKENKTLGYNIDGIYRIGVFQSHTEEYILIKEGSNFKILSIEKIDSALKEIIDYCVKQKFEIDDMLFYINRASQIYKENNNSSQLTKVLQ